MDCLFAFRSRSQAVAFYDAARRRLPVRLISTPSAIARGCGLSVRASYDRYHALAELFSAYRFSSFLGAYAVDGNRIYRLS